MASSNNIKISVGLEDVNAPGGLVARKYVIPIRGVSELDTEIKKEEDPAISGRNMTAGYLTTGLDSKGSIPITARPTPGMACLVRSGLGGGQMAGVEMQGEQVGALIAVQYLGSEESCKISISGTNFSASVGVKGNEAADSGFGTTGTLDLTGLTIQEVIDTIDGYSDYAAALKLGDPSGAGDQILQVSQIQAKGMWAYIWFASTTSGAYLYQIDANIGTEERPTLSLQYDGRQTNEVYNGSLVDTLSLSASLQGMVEAEAGILAFAEYSMQIVKGDVSGSTITLEDNSEIIVGMTVEGTGIPTGSIVDEVLSDGKTVTIDQTATTGTDVELTFAIPANAEVLEDVDPMIFAHGHTSFGENDYQFVSSAKVELTNNSKADGFGQGSLSRLYHQKGKFGLKGNLTIRLDETSIKERAKVKTGKRTAISLGYKGKIISASIPEYMLIEVPYAELTNFKRPDNSGVFDASIDFEATSPKGTTYNPPVRISMVIEKAAI